MFCVYMKITLDQVKILLKFQSKLKTYHRQWGLSTPGGKWGVWRGFTEANYPDDDASTVNPPANQTFKLFCVVWTFLFLILALFKWNFRSHESLPNGFAKQNAKSNTLQFHVGLSWNLKCERLIVLCVCSFPIGLIWIGGRYPTMCRAGLHHHPLCAECSANDKWGSRSPPPHPLPAQWMNDRNLSGGLWCTVPQPKDFHSHSFHTFTPTHSQISTPLNQSVT